MKIGIMGARADSRGLAYQTEAFAKWLVPDRVYGIDMTVDKLSPYATDWSGFIERSGTHDLTVSPFSRLNEKDIRSWLRGLDVVIGAETFYAHDFCNWARQEGVRTILQINPEFAAWWQNGCTDPKPDVFITPTTWLLDKMPGAIHLPFPVDREVFPFRLREQAKHFVHIAGHQAMSDRAGTRTLFAVFSRHRDTHFTIRSQSRFPWSSTILRQVNIEQSADLDPPQLYADADVILLPRRYGGQSMVANEALSSGCPVIMIDRAPENTWPGVITVRGVKKRQLRTKGGVFDVWEGSHTDISTKITQLSKDPDSVVRFSRLADSYAESISWDRLLPDYMRLLRG